MTVVAFRTIITDPALIDNYSKYVSSTQADRATLVNGQYLLTVLANHYNIPTKKITERVGDDNIYYKHHCGSLKYNNPIVPTDYIIEVDNKKILL